MPSGHYRFDFWSPEIAKEAQKQAIGTICDRTKKAASIEACPMIHFWTDEPRTVRENFNKRHYIEIGPDGPSFFPQSPDWYQYLRCPTSLLQEITGKNVDRKAVDFFVPLPSVSKKDRQLLRQAQYQLTGGNIWVGEMPLAVDLYGYPAVLSVDADNIDTAEAHYVTAMGDRFEAQAVIQGLLMPYEMNLNVRRVIAQCNAEEWHLSREYSWWELLQFSYDKRDRDGELFLHQFLEQYQDHMGIFHWFLPKWVEELGWDTPLRYGEWYELIRLKFMP